MDKNLIQINAEIELKEAASEDLAAVCSWFLPAKRLSTNTLSTDYYSTEKTQSLLRHWAGSAAHYPCTLEQLASLIAAGRYQSHVLHDKQNILGFGQIQLANKRAHLARLAINPDYRGRGLVNRLLTELIECARSQEAINIVSLFVNLENTKALAAYEIYGFSESATPNGIKPVPGCRFMTLRC
jgi:ribosomal protein S18 acetylase RimI-like enzyme